MKNLNYKIEKIFSVLDKNNDFVILDVDRTIINTTSWYQACITDDLLISKDKIPYFRKLNDERFKNQTKLSDKEFRSETFKLIEQRTTKNFMDRIKEFQDIHNFLNLHDYTNLLNFYVAGNYIARHSVTVYKTAIDYILWLSRFYGNNLKVIFLTSGYEPFIRGVVDEIVKLQRLKKINYIVVGSEVEFNNGKIKEIFHMSQYDKKSIVKQLINNGGKIRFLADDSKEDMELFDIVRKNGGDTLIVEHQSNVKENISWNNYIKQVNEEKVKKELMTKQNTIKMSNSEIELPDFLKKLSNMTNKIGISYMKYKRFNNAVLKLKEKFEKSENKEKFTECIQKVTFKKNETIYLRGSLFYNWLPQYIFFNNKSLNKKWKDLMNTVSVSLQIIQEEKILEKKISYEEQVIIYLLLDHIQEGVLFLLNLMEQNNLEENILKESEHEDVIELEQEISDLLYSFYYSDERTSDILSNVIYKIKKIKWIEELPEYVPKYKTMRELDDNITIFKFVKRLAEDIKKNKIELDYIISFPYGGITLGFALNSYLKIVEKISSYPKILNCHFSSKQAMRERRVESSEEFSVFKYIPKVYDKYMDKIKNGTSCVLLLDNNVTTFKTLDISKKYLKQIGNSVYCAVVAVNYNNIVNYLFEKKCEILVEDWRKVLDFYPVQEYVTAFNTWNTSDKSKILQEIYYKATEINRSSKEEIVIESSQEYIFKVCRIQNVHDLNTAIRNKANMIGIHAVYPDRIKYLKNELKYRPINVNLNIREELPIDIFQLEAIKQMQKYIPRNVKQAILFERKIDVKDILETCKLYNILPEKVFIQLQYRTDNQHISEIKSKVSKKIIATIGIFQKDFNEYFWKIHDALNPETDYILIDLSKHQPDLISYSEDYKENIDRIAFFKHQAKFMRENEVPIIIADDTTTYQMREYLKIIENYNIKIKGIDIQNIVEINSKEQKYQLVDYNGNVYQTRIRKSPDLMAEWKVFFENLNKDIFKR